MLKNTNMNTVTNTKENIFNACFHFRISNANESCKDVRDANRYKYKRNTIKMLFNSTNTNTKIQKIQQRCICLFQGLLVQLRVDAERQEEAIPEREKLV